MEKKKLNFWNIILISFSHFAHDVYTAFLSPLLPLLIDKYNLSYTKAGGLSAIRSLPTLLNPIIGSIVDKKGGKWLIILAPSISAIFMTLIGIAPNYGILLLFLLIVGINSTLYHVPAPVVTRALAGDKIGMGMSLFMVGGELARTLGPIIAMAAVSWWGLEGLWKLIPFGVFASLLIWLRFKKLNIKGLAFSKNEQNLKPATYTLKKFYKFFILLALFLVFRSMLRTGLTFFLPTYLKTQGFSLWFASISLSILQGAGIIGTLFGGSISDYIGRKNMLIISALVVPILSLIFLNLNSAILVIVILVLIGLLLFTTTPTLLAFVQDLKTDRPAFTNSIYMLLNFFSNVGASLLLGILSDKIGLYQSLKLVTILAFGAIPVVLLFENDKKMKS